MYLAAAVQAERNDAAPLAAGLGEQCLCACVRDGVAEGAQVQVAPQRRVGGGGAEGLVRLREAPQRAQVLMYFRMNSRRAITSGIHSRTQQGSLCTRNAAISSSSSPSSPTGDSAPSAGGAGHAATISARSSSTCSMT